jgi:CDGSH-type Zn-finger protein
MILTPSLLLAAAIAVNTLVAGQFTPLSSVEQCPLVLGCCEEDCCGAGTSWESPFCASDPDSTGFNGTHSSAWDEGASSASVARKSVAVLKPSMTTVQLSVFPKVPPNVPLMVKPFLPAGNRTGV